MIRRLTQIGDNTVAGVDSRAMAPCGDNYFAGCKLCTCVFSCSDPALFQTIYNVDSSNCNTSKQAKGSANWACVCFELLIHAATSTK